MTNDLEVAVGRPVSRETIEKLRAYESLVRAENRRQNLVSRGTLDALWERHILDSAQLLRFSPSEVASWIDIGAGAGFPGIVISCLAAGSVTLVEPRALRADFLRQCVRALNLNARVEQARAERITGPYDVITGRAVAALPRFLTMCDHLSTRKTVWVLPKGRSAQSELEETRRSWQGVFHVEQSITDPDAKIVIGTGVRAKRS